MNQTTILLVEDNPDDAELALLGFKKINSQYHIQVAPSGEEALEYLFASGRHQSRPPEHKPALVLLDVNLPRLSGFEVLKSLRGSPEYRHTPVILLTTSDEQCDMDRGRALGASSYLCKPVDFDSFTRLLQQISRDWLTLQEAQPIYHAP